MAKLRVNFNLELNGYLGQVMCHMEVGKARPGFLSSAKRKRLAELAMNLCIYIRCS